MVARLEIINVRQHNLFFLSPSSLSSLFFWLFQFKDKNCFNVHILLDRYKQMPFFSLCKFSENTRSDHGFVFSSTTISRPNLIGLIRLVFTRFNYLKGARQKLQCSVWLCNRKAFDKVHLPLLYYLSVVFIVDFSLFLTSYLHVHYLSGSI